MTPMLHHPQGTIIAYFLVLIAALTTGLLTTLALSAGNGAQLAGLTLHRDQAFYTAEAGIQRAIWNLNQNPAWRASAAAPLVGTLQNGGVSSTYTVTCIDITTGVKITSTVQPPTAPAYSQIVATVLGGGSAPGLAVGNNMGDSGTLLITGTVQTKGSVTRSGTMTLSNIPNMPNSDLQAMGSLTSSGTFNAPGNLLFNGAISSSGTVNVAGNVQSGGAIGHSGTWHVTGTSSAWNNPNLQINTPTVDTASLVAKAQADGTVVAGGAKSNYTIDFTHGANHVVCVSGNLTLSGTTTVIGSGTLIVQGTLSLSGFLGAVGNPLPINVVTTGDATMSGTFYINGCLCSGGNFTKSGATNINGIVVVQNSLIGSGNITMTYQTPPSFVHYTGIGNGTPATGAQVLFVGPIF